MKKLIVLTIAAFLTTGIVVAQDKTKAKEKCTKACCKDGKEKCGKDCKGTDAKCSKDMKKTSATKKA
jgi:hypothetical protein